MSEAKSVFNLVDFVDILSDRDTKSLSEKALKTCEETGELAKAVLAYEGTSGSGHRLVSRQNVVEEVADTILCAYSVARGVGADPVEIMAMIAKKARYWETLQTGEQGIDLKGLHFEIHVTVEGDTTPANFRNVCQNLGVKPIMLDLYREGEPIDQIMTSSKFTGTTAAVQAEVDRISDGMERAGFLVTRRKVESIPEHPHANWAVSRGQAGSNRYYEAHIAFLYLRPELKRELSDTYNIHFSRNRMKSGENSVIMGTLRRLTKDATLPEFRRELETVLLYSNYSGATISGNPRIVEYAIFDDNVADDGLWMQSEITA